MRRIHVISDHWRGNAACYYEVRIIGEVLIKSSRKLTKRWYEEEDTCHMRRIHVIWGGYMCMRKLTKNTQIDDSAAFWNNSILRWLLKHFSMVPCSVLAITWRSGRLSRLLIGMLPRGGRGGGGKAGRRPLFFLDLSLFFQDLALFFQDLYFFSFICFSQDHAHCRLSLKRETYYRSKRDLV